MAAVKVPVWEEGLWSDERCEFKYSGKRGERMLHKECVKYKRQFCEEFTMICPGAGASIGYVKDKPYIGPTIHKQMTELGMEEGYPDLMFLKQGLNRFDTFVAGFCVELKVCVFAVRAPPSRRATLRHALRIC